MAICNANNVDISLTNTRNFVLFVASEVVGNVMGKQDLAIDSASETIKLAGAPLTVEDHCSGSKRLVTECGLSKYENCPVKA
jgi:hypothetical protein